MTTKRAEGCAVPAGRPLVVVVVAHRTMRALIVDLLAGDQDHWAVLCVDSLAELGMAGSPHPDLVIVDTGDFDACCRGLPRTIRLGRVVVIGPEPDPSYRHAALRRGAGGWLSREFVAEELGAALRSATRRRTPSVDVGPPR